ncbi:hypothetical protein AB4Y35_18285 [Paraburkholderia sp. EG286A]|uniref:hypothetical protein n=1 Tax=Paraburkholderia sp. EG286A TaxID=3237014 RepID=UPI0034D2F799
MEARLHGTDETTEASGSAALHRDDNRTVPPGRLLGVTATGPVYRGLREYTLAPVAGIFATLQELAQRIDRDDAVVTSSIAKRVAGKDAYQAWLTLSVSCAAQLAQLSPRGRIKFLSLVIAFIRMTKRSAGLETIYTGAINATWPWLSASTCNSVLALAEGWNSKSEVAQRHPVAVVDVNRRTAGIYGAGKLAQLDLADWRASQSLQQDGLLPGNTGGLCDALGEAMKSPLERAIDQFFGSDSSGRDSAGSLMPGKDTSGVPGGLPSAGDLPGQKNSAGGRGQSMEDKASDLMGSSKSGGIPGGLPSASDLPGQHKDSKPGKSIEATVDGLLAGAPTNEFSGGGVSSFLREHGSSGFKSGIFDRATPGGPFAPPGQLGINGRGGEKDEDEANIANGVIAVGATVIAVALVPEVPLIVAGAAIAVGAAGGWLIGMGLSGVIHGHDKPEPPKHEPRKGDLYPDPFGEGGGNPAQLPAFDGSGGGNPATLPDIDGHGEGMPNTIWGKPTGGASIWDDSFGGHGPTVKPESFAVPALVGPGLMVDVVQVGRSALRY